VQKAAGELLRHVPNEVLDISKEGPFKLDTFKYARALWKDDATLRVYVTNHDWSAKQLGRLTLPIKDKGQAIATLSLYQKDEVVTIGNYDKRGCKEPMSSSVGLDAAGAHVLRPQCSSATSA